MSNNDVSCLTLTSTSPLHTETVGRTLANIVPDGSVIALRGDLASGKTCLVRGMASAFASHDNVHSPTFTLVNEYCGSRNLYHIDLYRLEDAEELTFLGLDELFEQKSVCVIEWAERAECLLPHTRIDIMFEHAGPETRIITICNHGVLPAGWPDALRDITHMHGGIDPRETSRG